MVVTAWTLDGAALAIMTIVGAVYFRCFRRARAVGAANRSQAWCFGVGLALWALATFTLYYSWGHACESGRVCASPGGRFSFG